MNGKTLLIFVVSVAFFTLAATYRFHDSAHSMGMIKKGGGVARHPALLDKGRDSYMLIATAGVMPPYTGNARVVLEGDPTLTATFYNSEVPVDLGLYRHPTFRGNTYYDLRPRDRIALWVRIKRNAVADAQQIAVAPTQSAGRPSEPLCNQCEPAEEGKPGSTSPARPTPESGGESRAAIDPAAQSGAWKGKGSAAPADLGKRWPGKGGAAMPEKGPALAFYDAASNEPLLRIPIRFTGGKGGGENDH